jgi:hypothetical protein
MRVVLVPLLLGVVLFACDQPNRPMPVPTGGTSSSSTGGPPAAPPDAGTGDAALPELPGDAPRVQPQPGDVQL